MIKKLDILIIRSFIGPFVVTFFVSLFVLVMQFFWLYMDELLGKGLGVLIILKLLFYMSATMVPLALPLGILLASIMTFGSLGESFELVAIKSAGISLLRFMRPLLLVIIGLGGFAFIFNNNLIPVAKLKAFSLLYDLRNSRPALNIREGRFNKDIEGYAIRVGRKGEDGHSIFDVMIYDHTSGYGNDNVVLAEKGDMISSPNQQVLIFRLENGWRYDEGAAKHGRRNSNEQKRIHFKQWDKVFDLSSFQLSRTNEDLFKGAYQMMNIRQLNEGIDSMRREEERIYGTVQKYLRPYLTLGVFPEKSFPFLGHGQREQSDFVYEETVISKIPDSLRIPAISRALEHIRASKGLVNIAATNYEVKKENTVKYNVEWHQKFTLSFACVLLFLIGAPLGAIIRKGGIGMPMVIAIAFFLIFHIMSVVGEKLVKSGAMAPWSGMWMATAMLLPVSFLLINASRKDIRIFTYEWFSSLWRRMKIERKK